MHKSSKASIHAFIHRYVCMYIDVLQGAMMMSSKISYIHTYMHAYIHTGATRSHGDVQQDQVISERADVGQRCHQQVAQKSRRRFGSICSHVNLWNSACVCACRWQSTTSCVSRCEWGRQAEGNAGCASATGQTRAVSRSVQQVKTGRATGQNRSVQQVKIGPSPFHGGWGRQAAGGSRRGPLCVRVRVHQSGETVLWESTSGDRRTDRRIDRQTFVYLSTYIYIYT